MAEGKTNMFGKTYNTIGSTDSNFIIKTKGDLKVLWGNKFIDIIKNGKIASNNSNILFTVQSVEEILKDGIYIVNNEDGLTELWICIGNNKILISNSFAANTYVSFLTPQEVTSNQQHQALTNIGFYYPNLNEAKNANITSGIIYIEDINKLYIVKDGLLSEYAINNTVKIDSAESGEVIEKQPLYILEYSLWADGSEYITCWEENILIFKNTTFYGSILSLNYSDSRGYKIYTLGDKSILEIDLVKLRLYPEPITYEQLSDLIRNKKLLSKKYYLITDFQNPWEVTWDDEPFYVEDLYTTINNTEYLSGLRNTTPLIVMANGLDSLEQQAWDPRNPDWVIHYDFNFKGPEHITYNNSSEIKLYGYRTRTIDDVVHYLPCKGKITYLKDEFGNEGNFNFRQFRFKTPEGKWRYIMDSEIDNILGNFIEGSYNVFNLESIDTYVLVFKFEEVKDTNDLLVEITISNIESDTQLEVGHNLYINKLINNNIFDLPKTTTTTYHTILSDINNNKFINISKLILIVQEISVKDNIFDTFNGILRIEESCEKNILKHFSDDLIITGTSFKNNLLSNFTKSIQNEGNFESNIINECTEVITNTGSIINNNINKIDAPITVNYTLENNIICDILVKLTINADIKNNSFKNIENCVFNGFLSNNIFYGDITNSTINLMTNNIAYKNIESLISENNITNCIFNLEIEKLTAINLNYCTFEYINTLTLDKPVYYTTFHGYIGGSNIKTITDYEWSLLSDSNKKKDAYPNIKIVCIPEIIMTGMILMWYGKEEIPKGWALCDGNNGTPNLIDRFIRGGDTTVPIDPEGVILEEETIGDKKFNINKYLIKEDHLPKHYHPHTHIVEKNNIETSTSTGGETDTGYAGAATVSDLFLTHYETVVTDTSDEKESTITIEVIGYDSNYSYVSVSDDIESHVHSVTIPDHSHTFDISITTSEDIETTKEWKNEKITIEPKSYSVIFIMKIDDNF